MARELVRASSVSCVQNSRTISRETLCGSPPRDQSSHRNRPPPQGRSSSKMRRTQVRRNEPESEGASDGR
jgi:hypothetical protein